MNGERALPDGPRPYNFSAGPAMLPGVVLERARDTLLDWGGSGMSVMEMSHRGPRFADIAARCESTLRRLLGIPAEYRVLFMQGGATMQFSCVVLNLLRDHPVADYLDSGLWSAKAIAEARRLGAVNVVASASGDGYRGVPERAEWRLRGDAAYLHYTANETINGVEIPDAPPGVEAPLVSDMSSTLLSRPIEIGRFGCIYAGAQKNLGIAGLTLVIIDEALLGSARPATPMLLDYSRYAETGSMLNTPPTWAWHMAGLTFEWIEDEGGLAAMEERNRAKAQALYGFIDESGFYRNDVDARWRSWMNVPFRLADDRLEGEFLERAEQAGLIGLKGHRSVGGMRASLYNAMPLAGVHALVDFMRDFAARRG